MRILPQDAFPPNFLRSCSIFSEVLKMNVAGECGYKYMVRTPLFRSGSTCPPSSNASENKHKNKHKTA